MKACCYAGTTRSDLILNRRRTGTTGFSFAIFYTHKAPLRYPQALVWIRLGLHLPVHSARLLLLLHCLPKSPCAPRAENLPRRPQVRSGHGLLTPCTLSWLVTLSAAFFVLVHSTSTISPRLVLCAALARGTARRARRRAAATTLASAADATRSSAREV